MINLKEPQISFWDLIKCISDVMDLMNPALVCHHRRVAYIALSLADELGLEYAGTNDLIFAGVLHDIGAFSLSERLDTLCFEDNRNFQHTECGFGLLSMFSPLVAAARIVRYHHVPWEDGKGCEMLGNEVLFESHVIHLADRVSVLLNESSTISQMSKHICSRIKDNSGSIFHPDIVEAFMTVANREAFWFDLISPSLENILKSVTNLNTLRVDMNSLLALCDLIRKVIDFRSRFTATHTSGLVAVSKAIARRIGFSDMECSLMEVAANFHDIGKLAVPREILEKPSRLTDDEYSVIKSHPYRSFRIFEPIEDFSIINHWGSLHHERLDGSGYPFHYNEPQLLLGTRIMAVGDVFTAITEDRPYRAGMSAEDALKILNDKAANKELDRQIVAMVEANFDEINTLRIEAQQKARLEYELFLK